MSYRVYRLELLRRRTKLAGLDLEVNSPGDGASRYRFWTPNNGVLLGFCLGIQAAEVWLNGYEAGKGAK